MFMKKEDKGGFGSFKFGYSRGLPSHLAPKLFISKKQEEYFLTSVLSHQLLYNDFAVTGVQVCEDDSNMGADTMITTESGDVGVQVTRFTLTQYNHRKSVAKKRGERIAKEIVALFCPVLPVNVTIHPKEQHKPPKDKLRHDVWLAKEIAAMIESNWARVKAGENFINLPIENETLKPFVDLITLQPIPEGCISNYHGFGNIFVNYEFDNVFFNESDVRNEAEAIFKKKDGGKSDILVIWADRFDILYNPDMIARHLVSAFRATRFKFVIFYSFFNRKGMMNEGPFFVKTIFDDDSLEVMLKLIK
jgi:hypothetical protein